MPTLMRLERLLKSGSRCVTTWPFHRDSSTACFNPRQMLVGLPATASVSSIMNVSSGSLPTDAAGGNR